MGRLTSPATGSGGPSRSQSEGEEVGSPSHKGGNLGKGLLSDRYTLGEELGRGAFGQVKSLLHPTLSLPVIYPSFDFARPS